MISEELRAQLISLARKRHLRLVGVPPEEPSRWHTYSVLHPISGFPFTDAGAWEFIAECMESGSSVQIISLDNPKGKEGYVLKYTSNSDREDIYMKVNLGAGGRIVGRSFHYDDPRQTTQLLEDLEK